MSEELKVTSIEELKKVACGTLVSLPPFVDGTEFNAMLKRPSMMKLAKSGRIPNQLLVSANSLFEEGLAGGLDSLDEEMLSKSLELMEIICQEAFVSPTWNELKANGIELTDKQYIFVFEYTQNGLKDLDSFRP